MARIINPGAVQKNVILDDLLTQIIKGDVILVLGHEHILKEEFSGGDIIKELTKTFFEYKHQKDSHFNSTYESFDEYHYKGAELSNMKREITESIDSNHYEFSSDDYSPMVLKLLQKKCFKVVLTTTFDYYAESIMRGIYGNQLKVLNIFDDKNKDIQDEDYWKKDVPPTLYYVFGRAETKVDYTVVDKDKMNVIQRWLGEKAPRNFCSYIKDKTILALGTKFDDWLFRFFWYAIHRDTKNLSKGQVAIALHNDNDSDVNLQQFLDNQKIPNTTIDEIVSLILNEIDAKEEAFRVQNGQNADIFISYSSDSYDTVKHLFYALQAEGFKVWFDKTDLYAGDNHKIQIISAINRCKVFIPVITNPVIHVLEEDIDSMEEHFHYFRDVEWNAAKSRSSNPHDKMVVMPFCMEGLDMKYVRIHPSQAGFAEFLSKTAADDRTQANFNMFIAELKKAVEK